ncbi:hypothetical protein [Dyella sp.]|uniref:hypothetical protein n=1 Tax=Dyella sp. TaxID=1869338 RepID=UPI0032172F95
MGDSVGGAVGGGGIGDSELDGDAAPDEVAGAVECVAPPCKGSMGESAEEEVVDEGGGVEVVDVVVVIEGRGALAAPLRNTGDSVVGLGDGVTMGDSVVLDVRVDEVDERCSGCPEVEDDDEGVELRGRPPPEPPLPEPLPLPLPEPLPPVPELPVPCGMTLIPPQGPRRLLRARGARQGAAAVGIRARRGLPARATIERLSPSPDATRMRLHPLPA